MLKRPNPKDLSLTNIIKKIAKKKNHKHFSKNEEASPLVVWFLRAVTSNSLYGILLQIIAIQTLNTSCIRLSIHFQIWIRYSSQEKSHCTSFHILFYNSFSLSLSFSHFSHSHLCLSLSLQSPQSSLMLSQSLVVGLKVVWGCGWWFRSGRCGWVLAVGDSGIDLAGVGESGGCWERESV